MSLWTMNLANRAPVQQPNASNSNVLPIKVKVQKNGILNGEAQLPSAGDTMKIQKMPGSVLYTSIQIFNSPGAPWAGGAVDVGYIQAAAHYKSDFHNPPDAVQNFDVPGYFAAAATPTAVRAELLTGIWKHMATPDQTSGDENRMLDHYITLRPAGAPNVDDELCLLVAYNVIG